MKKVLLYSGGMDSWLIDKLWKPDVRLFFDIGTENNKKELKKIIDNGTDCEIVTLPLAQFEQVDNNYFLPLRNLHFVVYAAHYGDMICLGATGSSTHKDKNEVFTTLSENVINYLLSEECSEPVKIVTPFKGMSKTDILARYIREGGDIHKCYEETFSCYNPTVDGKPCMSCTSCFSKFTAFYNNGYRFDADTEKKFVENVLSNPHAKGDSYRLAIKLKYNKKLVCVDFDNTLTEKSTFPKTGRLRKNVIEFMNNLHEHGYYTILYTSREGVDFIHAKRICQLAGLKFDEYLHKQYASHYLDDKAFMVNTDTDLDILAKEVFNK